MSGSPIFDQLQAEFVAESKYIRLQIGPLIGQGFERVEVIDEHFGTTGYVNRLVEYGPTIGEGFEVVDGITKMIEVEDTSKPQMYVVIGAPELINIDKMKEEVLRLDNMAEETDMEKTLYMPVVKSDMPKPPSLSMMNETRLIPKIDEKDATFKATTTAEEESHVFPIKRVKAVHKKIGATGTLSWFANRAA